MIAKSFLLQFSILSLCIFALQAQNPQLFSNQISGYETDFENNELQPCITQNEYQLIERRIAENLKRLNLNSEKQVGKSLQKISLSWPLKASDSLTDCSYYRISAYVDQNTAAGAFQDFNCGSNTYDGHKGTDISISPFNFLKMDHNWVEVIAAAGGTIVDKHDGEFDKNCAATSMMANYLVVKHDDGSQALYFHMKNNSLTTKTVGQKLIAGEHVGFVGSSGNSSGPHLHFEVWSGSTSATLVDPFYGTCNKLNNSSWWEMQKPYKETGIVKVSANTTDIVIPACPGTEIPNETKVFQLPFQGAGLPVGFAKFYIFIREELNGLTATMEILNPDSTVFTSWTYVSTADSKSRIQGWTKKLPVNAGKYLFKASYNGQSCQDTFLIKVPVKSSDPIYWDNVILSPNPNNGNFHIDLNETSKLYLEIFNLLGQKILSKNLDNKHHTIHLNVKSGIYLYRLSDYQQHFKSGKIIIKTEP